MDISPGVAVRTSHLHAYSCDVDGEEKGEAKELCAQLAVRRLCSGHVEDLLDVDFAHALVDILVDADQVTGPYVSWLIPSSHHAHALLRPVRVVRRLSVADREPIDIRRPAFS